MRYLTLILFSIFCLNAFTQEVDTLFYNADRIGTTPESAHYYRTKPLKKDSLYVIKEFYTSGKLKMLAYSLYDDYDVLHGEAKRYDEKGNITEVVNYNKGVVEGDYIKYDSTGVVVSHCQFHKNNPVQGTYLNQLNLLNSTITFKDGVITKQNVIPVDGKYKFKIVKELFVKKDDSIYKEKTYDLNDNLIGEGTYSTSKNKEEIIYNGVIPDILMADKAFVLKFYTTGKLDSTMLYHGDYKFKKTTFFNAKERVDTFFDRNGKVMSLLTYKDNKPFNGVSFDFEEKEPLSYYTYKNGLVDGEFLIRNSYIHEIIEKGQYKKASLDGKISYYDEQSNNIAECFYSNGVAKNGAIISKYDKYKYLVYKNNKLVETKKYYPDRHNIAWIEYQDSLTITYNKQQKVIGMLTYKNKKPYYGKKYEFSTNYDIIAEGTYKNGIRIEYKSFKSNGSLKKTIKQNSANNYTITEYYPNGKKQSVLNFFESDKSDKTIIYFDKKGNQIGTLNKVNYDKNGTEIEFKETRIKEIRKYRNDTLIYKKVYDSNSVPVLEIDFYAKAKYYNMWGELKAEGTYQNGKPFNGTFYDYKNSIQDRNVKLIFSMKNGQLNGPKIYYYANNSFFCKRVVSKKEHYLNGKLEGPVKEFKYTGEPISTVFYKAGKKEGTAIFVTPDGVKTNGTYKNNSPFTGTFIEYKYGKIKKKLNYKNGEPHGTWTYYNDDGSIARFINY